MDENKRRALEVAFAQIEKQYGKGAVMKLGDPAAQMNVERARQQKNDSDNAYASLMNENDQMEIQIAEINMEKQKIFEEDSYAKKRKDEIEVESKQFQEISGLVHHRLPLALLHLVKEERTPGFVQCAKDDKQKIGKLPGIAVAAHCAGVDHLLDHHLVTLAQNQI